MGRNRETDKFGNKRTWTWQNKINIGDDWTLLAVECHLMKSCNGCVYYKYCKQTKSKKHKTPVLKRVIKGLFQKFGKPPKQFLDKARNLTYY